MRLLVCGGRNYADREHVYRVLDELQPTLLIHGNARGADQLADRWGTSNRVATVRFPANWYEHGEAAGPIRNKEMLEVGKPDMVLAFPGGKGTAHMVKIAEEAGITVRAEGAEE